MQTLLLEVAFDSSLHHSLALVAQKFFDSSIRPFFPGTVPAVVPLRVASASGVAYVGILTRQFHSRSGHVILFPRALGSDLRIAEGETVECYPCNKLPVATKVLVSPISVDESEIVEKNALQIESQLLRQLQIVSPGMPITVFLFSGMTAKVKVTEIECGESNVLTSGGAIMSEGTLFIVATRQRVSNVPGEEARKATWGVIRCLPGDLGEQSTNVVCVHSSTAKQYGWMDGMKLAFLDLVSLASTPAEGSALSASFLRAEQVSIQLQVNDEVPIGSSWSKLVTAGTNALFSPDLQGVSSETVNKKQIPEVSGTSLPSWEDVCQVHGALPGKLLHHLELCFSCPSAVSKGNVLLSGGRGCGKTTIVEAVRRKLKGPHVVAIKCFSGKTFLQKLQQSILECVLCAPSVLVLDDFDEIAPEQREGNNAAMTNATRALLNATICQFCSLRSFAKSPVVVVATCQHRDSVHQSFRTAAMFPSCMSVEALNRSTRKIMLNQLMHPQPQDVGKMLASFENYTPFDMYQLSQRVQCSMKPNETLLECVQRVSSSFTPLAHSGISFLKGAKVDWGNIGGLKDAKKILYETLVLPIQHPLLFSRLPLKTRSGLLLYGPSGCGKTFILESLVNAEGLNCLVVNGPEVFGKYIGQSEQKIRDIFERAQAAAPCVVFFDEFDSVAPQRGMDNSGVTDRVVNQLLCYLDGVEGRKDVFVVAASSRPDLIDAALLRPGRLDKAVACPIPSYEDRLDILTSLLREVDSSVLQADIAAIANDTQLWTPADLSALVATANTTACQRVLSALPVSGSTGDMNEDTNYLITDFSSAQKAEKTKDSLRFLGSQTAIQTESLGKIEVTMNDLSAALRDTRPSLSQKDVREFQRISALFSNGTAAIPPARPGTKLTSN